LRSEEHRYDAYAQRRNELAKQPSDGHGHDEVKAAAKKNQLSGH
jgi:hypothetical protein